MSKIENTEFIRVDIPEGITSFLEKKSGIFRNEKIPSYGVNEIVRCLRKSFYERTSKKRKSKRLSENLWPSVRGDLLHEMTKAYNWNELDMDIQIPHGNGKFSTISGRLDMYDWKTKTIIDLKTTKDIFTQAEQGSIPKKEDILQIQCYGTIFSGLIPVSRLILVYADLNDMIAFQIKSEDKTWWLKDRIIKLEKSLLGKVPPTREFSRLCKFCKFSYQCDPFNTKFLNEYNHTMEGES